MISQLFEKYKIPLNIYLKTIGFHIYNIDNKLYLKIHNQSNLLSESDEFFKKLLVEIVYVMTVYDTKNKNRDLYNNISNAGCKIINGRELILDFLTQELFEENRKLKNINRKLYLEESFDD